MAFFLAAFAGAVAITALAVRTEGARWLNRGRPWCVDATRPSDTAYLSYFHGAVDFYSLYNNFDGTCDALRNADVLILGNSRVAAAFSDEAMLDRFFTSRSLRYYVLAFVGEESAFPSEIIRRNNLHPKWVIVSAAPFFGREPSKRASKVMSDSLFDAYKFDFETLVAFHVQRQLHRIVPFLGPAQWIRGQPDPVSFRSSRTGVTYPFTPPDATRIPAVAGTDAYGSRWDEGLESIAVNFNNNVERRGGRVLITRIPPDSTVSAQRFGKLLAVPFLDVNPPGLYTYDGSHLDPVSASEFLSEFLKALTPVIDQSPPEH